MSVYSLVLKNLVVTFGDRGHDLCSFFVFSLFSFSNEVVNFPQHQFRYGIIRSGCTLSDMKVKNNLCERGRLQ